MGCYLSLQPWHIPGNLLDECPVTPGVRVLAGELFGLDFEFFELFLGDASCLGYGGPGHVHFQHP